MDSGTVTQLITVGATLGGVVLTSVGNAFLERRRAQDSRELESLRSAAGHAAWLRDERLKAYAGLSLAGEEALQFIRSDLRLLLGSDAASQRADTEARWRELRTQLRKAYNQVALFGAEPARLAGREIWRTARNGGNDFWRDLNAAPDSRGLLEQYERLEAIVKDLGTAGDHYLEACRRDLQRSD